MKDRLAAESIITACEDRKSGTRFGPRGHLTGARPAAFLIDKNQSAINPLPIGKTSVVVLLGGRAEETFSIPGRFFQQ